jgi:hypothetical protein
VAVAVREPQVLVVQDIHQRLAMVVRVRHQVFLGLL